MAKCEKCGKEYLDGAEHVCSLPDKKTETDVSEKVTPVKETQPQKTENPTQ